MIEPQGFEWIIVRFWDLFEDKLGYGTTVRIKDLSLTGLTFLSGAIIGAFLIMRFQDNLMKIPSIENLGTVKIRDSIIRNLKSALETIDTINAIIAIKLFPERAKIVGRALWIIAIFLIILALVSSFVILEPYKDYMLTH
ncbi:hypothetical protein [Desulfosporosinus sp. FKA]|uniref:hypothetical protein n=1 Tax=Desulfosporosinus sp. FKA TaxID=1969834 RepID=UPI000B49F146|nr:hypothetical protein [Desulfosporosinus sp. FKA]